MPIRHFCQYVCVCVSMSVCLRWSFYLLLAGNRERAVVCKGSRYGFGVSCCCRLYDAASAQIVEKDMTIMCARSAHKDSSIYVYQREQGALIREQGARFMLVHYDHCLTIMTLVSCWKLDLMSFEIDNCERHARWTSAVLP